MRTQTGARWTVEIQQAPSQRSPSALLQSMHRSCRALPTFLMRSSSVRSFAFTHRSPKSSSTSTFQYCPIRPGTDFLQSSEGVKKRSLWASTHLVTWAQPTWNRLKILKTWRACRSGPWVHVGCYCRMKLTRNILPCTCTWRNEGGNVVQSAEPGSGYCVALSLVCTISWW